MRSGGSLPPATARKAVQSHAANLRKAINVADEYIVGRGNGYLVEVEPDQVDSLVFERRIGAGREALGSDPLAARRALATDRKSVV